MAPANKHHKAYKTILTIPLAARSMRGRRVLIRADFDEPLNGSRLADDFRIKTVVPTIKALLKNGASVRILSHLGRPEGKHVSALSMKKIARYLEPLIHRRIIFISDPFSKIAKKRYLDSSEVLFFENLRFWPGEENNEKNFAASLAEWGDVYVNEAFADCHRTHASMVRLPALLPAYAGQVLAREILNLTRVSEHPPRPLIAILGGAKLETKLPLIKHFLEHADRIMIGGALANTFFALQSFEIGKSKADREYSAKNKRLLQQRKIWLPHDVIVSKSLGGTPSSIIKSRHTNEVMSNEYIVDIGPESIKEAALILAHARTIVWNGPVGYAERDIFAAGTKQIAKAILRSKALSVIGGGDTISVLRKHHLINGFTHISCGGGAMLEFLSGRPLPALDVLVPRNQVK